MPGKDNLVADTLSRSQIASINCNNSFDLISIAKAQQGLTFEDNKYKAFELGDNLQIFCEISTANPRPFVPVDLRFTIFSFFHKMSHPGKKATSRLVGSRYFWPTIKPDVQKWVAECLSCQSSKVHRHTKNP